ncbi:hypothetical protein GCM10011571_33500 [Marinithermofilum abyssi]|uniref:Uncharacterized protein n=1 Tax=Marinithermofilum abyssi TaxID=1571185 RepID=A0A8J2VKR9_9BACL|nr:replication-relaxation family protein [Marinithermofilum abyssi]GGE28684.1 hypothetical protein GCM10011571_33500 [Marinithermofilum abyssi]
MQLRDIVSNPYLTRGEELLGIIYKLRMVSAEQLSVIMGISKKYVFQLKSDLNKEGEMVLTHYNTQRGARRVPFSPEYKLGPRMYSLGPSGRAIVEAIVGHPVYLKKLTGRQKVHYYGVNDILVRTLQHLIKEEGGEKDSMAQLQAWDRLQWLNSQEAVEIINQAWTPILENRKKKEEKETKQDLIHPDSRIVLDGQGFWLEYDNGTEQIGEPDSEPDSEGKVTTIYDKMWRYLLTLIPIENHDPIIWVTPSPIRRDNMKHTWEKVKEESSYKTYPEMYFCTPGEEQTIFFKHKLATQRCLELSETY